MSRHYRYEAKNWNGEKVRGSLTAPGPGEALKAIQSRRLVALEIKEQSSLIRQLGTVLRSILNVCGFQRCSSRDLMIFCRQFSTMLEAGVSVLQALTVLSAQMENLHFRAKLQDVSMALEQGSDLSGALQAREGFFPPLLYNMTAAGEAGGMLGTVMERMAGHYENRHDMEQKIRSATAYPLFITAVAALVVLVMIVFVLPQFAGIFNAMGMEMPLLSRVLMNAGQVAAARGPYLLLGIPVLAVLFIWYTATENGRRRVDRLRLVLPLYGKIYRLNTAARFSRTLGTLLAGGVTLHSALDLADRVIGNAIISSSISELSEALSRGETVAGPMTESGSFPPLLVEMVRVGEETGTLEETLDRAALFYEKEVSYIVERLGSVLEPALLLAVGLFIGLLVFSILSPMYKVFEMI